MRLPRNLQCLLVFGFTLATAVVAFGHPSSANAFDHVTNGDFENGAIGWSATRAAFDVVPGDSVAMGTEGTVGMLLLGGEGSFSLRQTSVAGTVSGTYAFAARIRLTSRMTSVVVQGSAAPSTTLFSFDIPHAAGEWFEISGPVTVTGYTNLTIDIGGTGSSGDIVYVDDVRFEGADPATMTPTYTPVPATATVTPLLPTATKTAKPTQTPKPNATAAAPTDVSATEPSSWVRGFEHVVNGGFEDVGDNGEMRAWEKYGGLMSASTVAAHDGQQAARLESTTDSMKWLFQTIGVTGGSSYAFDAWLLHDDAAVATAFLRISWYATADGSGSALGTADSTERLAVPSVEWRHLTTGGVAAPQGARSANLRVLLQPVSGVRAAIHVDDASFRPAAPASAAESPAEAEATGNATTDRAVRAGSRQAATDRSNGVFGSSAVRTGLSAPVVINEVLYDLSGDDDGAPGEWLELYNASDSPISLEGWTIADAAATDVLEAVTIPPHGFVVIAASVEFSAGYPAFNGPLLVLDGPIGNGLRNSGDLLVLLDSSGQFVDTVSWGDNTTALDPPVEAAAAGHSIERWTAGADRDRADDFGDNGAPSPGRAWDEGRATLAAATGGSSSVEVLRGESSFSFSWLPWLAAALSMAMLGGVASWRLLPPLAGRLRHP